MTHPYRPRAAYIPARSLIVEEKPAGIWRTRLVGPKVRAGAPEGRTGDPSPFTAAIQDAMLRSRRTGLPVIVKAFGEPPRWPNGDELARREFAPLCRRTLDDLLPPWNGGARG